MALTRKKGLGRGLDALFVPEKKVDEIVEKNKILELDIHQIEVGSYQPRSLIDKQTLTALAESIKRQGIIQPIIVRKNDNTNQYEIIAGERRWRASQLAGMKTIPAIVYKTSDQTTLIMALIENLQREELNPIDKAHGIKRLIDQFNFTHQEAAEALGQARSSTTNLLRLLNLPQSVQQLIRQNKLEMGHAKSLLTLPEAEQIKLSNNIVSKNLSVREIENVVRSKNDKQGHSVNKHPTATEKTPHNNQELCEQVAKKLDISISVERATDQEKGKITIEFQKNNQIKKILTILANEN